MSSQELQKEVVKFYYFSENATCGDKAAQHEEYCAKMLSDGYTLLSVTPLGNLDDRRDSYEGTIIYHWKLLKKNL